jgi:hypothetical protein
LLSGVTGPLIILKNVLLRLAAQRVPRLAMLRSNA